MSLEEPPADDVVVYPWLEAKDDVATLLPLLPVGWEEEVEGNGISYGLGRDCFTE